MGNHGLKQHYETASKTGVLQISDHKLREIPPEVLNLSERLRNLDLSKNRLSQITESITSFKHLKHLNLECNKLHYLPEPISKLHKLEYLNASFNSIVELPESFCGLINLKQLYMNHNQLTKFPSQLINLKNLEVVELSNNKLTEIPSGMSRFYATELNVSQNQISRIAEDLSEAPRLKILRMEENCLSLDAISPSLLRNSKIHTLHLDGNLFEAKQLSALEGYNEYTERYTAMKKKMF